MRGDKKEKNRGTTRLLCAKYRLIRLLKLHVLQTGCSLLDRLRVRPYIIFVFIQYLLTNIMHVTVTTAANAVYHSSHASYK